MAELNGSGVRLELRGGAMQLRFDLNALIEVEDAYGSLDGFQVALSVKPFRTVRHALWLAGTWLGDDAAKPTSEEEVGRLLDPQRLRDADAALGQALLEALGKAEPEAEADPTTAATAGIPGPG
jgi:hypothetical protein